MKISQPVAFALASLLQAAMLYGLYLGLAHTFVSPPSLSMVSVELISDSSTESSSEEPKREITPPKAKPVTQKAVVPAAKLQSLVTPAVTPTSIGTAPVAAATPQMEQALAAPPSNDAQATAATSIQPQLSPATPPRFDVDYLNNPAPAYPILSRRMGEQGRVLVRVFINAKGIPEDVHLYKSSNFSRLDEVAVKTVSRWRFVPARRGNESVADWVIVPVDFQLN